MVEVNLDEDFYKAFRKLLEALRSYNKEIVVKSFRKDFAEYYIACLLNEFIALIHVQKN
jgi:hypothetical protein